MEEVGGGGATPPAAPAAPNSSSSSISSKEDLVVVVTKNRRRRSPQELISHYQAGGLGYEEASAKVIEDLQDALFDLIISSSPSSANNNNYNNKSSTRGKDTSSRKMDAVGARLAVVDKKLDTKPGYVETFAIGVASASALRGIESVWPHVVEGVSHIWAAVSSLTKPPSTPPSSS